MPREIPQIPLEARLPMSGEGSSLEPAESQITPARMRADLRGEASDEDLVGLIGQQEDEPPLKKGPKPIPPVEGQTQNEGDEPPEGEEAAPDDEAPEGDDEAPEGDDVDGTVLKFKIPGEDGEEAEVETTFGELKSAYVERQQLQTELETRTRELEETGFQVQQVVDSQRTEYIAALGRFQQALVAAVAPEFEGVNMAQLAKENPAQYIQMQERMNQIQGLMAQIQTEQERHAEHAKSEGQKARAEAARKSVKILSQRIKGWNKEVYERVLAGATKNFGFNPQEVGAIIDPRVIEMAYWANKGKQAASKQTIVEKRITKSTPVLKPGQGKVRTGQSKSNVAFKQFLAKRDDKSAVAYLLSKGIG